MTPEEIAALYREQSGAILATLIRRLRDFHLAEEWWREWFAAAIAQWPREGAPEHPIAWLVQTAKHKAIDRLRREPLHREAREDRRARGDRALDLRRGRRPPDPRR